MTDLRQHPSPTAIQTPLRALRDAQRLVFSDLALPAMAERIAEAACAVSGASYAGLILLDAGGELLECAQYGLSGRDASSLADLIGPVSSGRGSTEERVRQLAAVGLRCLPVLAHGERVAELYLPRAVVSLPADEHDPADADERADVLEALLTIVGGGIENAMLHAEAERSKDWLDASGEITRMLLADHGADTLMDVVNRALIVADADYAALCIPRTDGLLEVAVATGVGADDYRGFVLDPANSLFAAAVAQGQSVLESSMAQIMRPGFDNPHDYGPVMLAPLADARGVRGSVVLCRVSGRRPFTARDLDHATIFADQIMVALGMDDARSQAAWLSVLEDRHRIAQDLHDNVMQRLFATGVGLQSLAAGAVPQDIGRRLGRYIADLDETIDEIRSRVFGLRDADGRQFTRATTRFPYIANPDSV